MTRAPWVTHFGFTRTPFSKSIPAKDLLERASHQEAVARIRFCIAESSLGVFTGEVGVGKTVAVRAAVSQLDQAAHHIVYLANPTVGTRGLYVTIVRALGAVPRGFQGGVDRPGPGPVGRRRARTSPPRRSPVRRGAPPRASAIGRAPPPDECRDGRRISTGVAPDRPTHAGAPVAHGGLCSLGSTRCHSLPDRADGPGRISQVPAAPPGAGRSD